MGVKDLWKLLETTGRPVTLESLEGLVLAVGEDNFLRRIVACNHLLDACMVRTIKGWSLP